MTRYYTLSIQILFITLTMLCALPYGRTDDESATKDSGMSLYGFLTSMPEKSNSALSPQGIKWLAAMMYAGADKQTAAELKTAFHFEDTPAEIAGHLNRATVGNAQSLRIANGIWADKRLALKPEFRKSMQEDFKAHLSVCDFVNDLKSIRTGMNEWINAQTGGNIPSLFDNLRSDSKLVLVNTICFRSKWQHAFDPKRTELREFTKSDEQITKLPMMREQLECSYGESEDAIYIELPYSQDNLAMLFILPKTPKGWNDVEKSMSEKKIADWCQSMEKKEVDCMIPKIELTASFDLQKVFKNLGTESPFSAQKANFTKMSGSDLFVSQAIQNVRLEVDESGTVASTASAAVLAPKALPVDSADHKQFYANRLFWFVLRNTETDAIFFLGRFVGSP